MTQLSANDLEYMRSALEELMPGTCYILSPAYTSNGAGEMTEVWGTAGTAICRLDARSGGESIQGASVKPVFSFILTLPHDTVIYENYRVEVGSDTFSVTSVDDGKSWNATTRVTLERI